MARLAAWRTQGKKVDGAVARGRTYELSAHRGLNELAAFSLRLRARGIFIEELFVAIIQRGELAAYK